MENIQILHAKFCEYSLCFKGNRPRTIKSFRDSFRSYMSHARHEDVAQVSRESIQKPILPKSIPKHLSKDEAQRVLEWTKNFMYSYKFERYRAVAIIATIMYTGIRLQELRNLKMVDIDFVEKTLFVKSGKGDKDRIVPLNNKLIEILQDYLKERARLRKTCPYFFTAMRDDTQMGDLVIKRLIIKIREKSKIPFYAHLLRHTFATLMLEGGCDLLSLSKMLGHSDIKTTTIYLSATTAHLQGQIEKHPLNIL